MSTIVGNLVQGIGEALAAAFTGYSVIYGQPVENGVRVPSGQTIRIHYGQERGTYAGSQLAGAATVQPLIYVTLERPYTGTPTDLTSHQESADLAADLRLCVANRILSHLQGSPMTGLSGVSVWLTGFVTTPAVLAIGPGQSRETVTIEFSIHYATTYGGR